MGMGLITQYPVLEVLAVGAASVIQLLDPAAAAT